MATRKERKKQEEVDRLLRSMGGEPQMVKRTREAAKTARFRTGSRAARYKALRQLARKVKVSRLEGEQEARGAAKKDKRTGVEKAADKTRAEFRADTVKAVRRGVREKPERERRSAEKASKAKEAKAAADKKAQTLAAKDKAFDLEERQRIVGRDAKAYSEFDLSSGRKPVKRSERLTRRERDLLKTDPKRLARLEAMVGKGIIGKRTRKARGPYKEEAELGGKSWLEEDLEEERRAKRRRRPKAPKKAAPKKAPPKRDDSEEAESMAFWAAEQKKKHPAPTPESKARFAKLPEKEQVKIARKGLTKKQEWQWHNYLDAGYTAGSLALAVYTFGGAAILGLGVRQAGKYLLKRKVAKETAKLTAKKAQDAQVKRAAAEAFAKQKAAEKVAREAKKKAAAEAREKVAREAREKAAREAKEKGGQNLGARQEAAKKVKAKAKAKAVPKKAPAKATPKKAAPKKAAPKKAAPKKAASKAKPKYDSIISELSPKKLREAYATYFPKGKATTPDGMRKALQKLWNKNKAKVTEAGKKSGTGKPITDQNYLPNLQTVRMPAPKKGAPNLQ